jgi:hypothetical protein
MDVRAFRGYTIIQEPNKTFVSALGILLTLEALRHDFKPFSTFG